jgi:membrane-associated protein
MSSALANHILANPISPDHLLSSFGVAGLAIILFAECGLLIGFFLPGDTILLAAGIAICTSTIKLSPLWVFLVVIPLAAIAGNLAGYVIGLRAGPAVFDRPNSRLFRPEYVTRSQAFYDKYGWPAVILARFAPIVRTVAPPMAGVAKMPMSRFVPASIIGGVLWSDGVLLAGYWLGHVSFVVKHKGLIDYAVIAVVVLGLLPTLYHALRGRRATS